MNERLHLQPASHKQFDELRRDQEPLNTARMMGTGTLNVVELLEKIDKTLRENITSMTTGNEGKTALEKLRERQGTRPGDSVSVPIYERGKRIHAVQKPTRIRKPTPKPQKS